MGRCVSGGGSVSRYEGTVDPDDVLIALADADGAISMLDLGNRMGLTKDGFRGRTWKYPAATLLHKAVTQLREEGEVVKLPHEGIRNGATYATCDDHEHASRMQLDACEAELAALEPEARAGLRGRMLRQALVGLRTMVADEGAA